MNSASLGNRASNLVALAMLLLIFLTPAAGFWWLRGMSREMVERNAVNHTRDILIRYTIRTRGQWPQSWDDLAEDFEPADAGYGIADIDELKHIIEVDFAFDPQAPGALDENSPSAPRIIRLKGGADADHVREANAKLAEHLRQRHL
ncbi:MAG: hypothetical protein KF861_03420 [Planctomycetaceae bacterium]|nr:hypothetical protein [Planctomycetaceae bacterium]